MFKKIVFFDTYTDVLTGTWTTFLLQGILLVLMAIAIILVPEILAVMVASSFLMLGVLSIVVAFKTRSLRNKYPSWRSELWKPF